MIIIERIKRNLLFFRELLIKVNFGVLLVVGVTGNVYNAQLADKQNPTWRLLCKTSIGIYLI
jgi:hypothetical protein